MKLDELSDFLLVATHEGFAQASRVSGRPKASLSRKVMELEARLGVRLLERDARTVRLTEEGALLLDRTQSPMRAIVEAAQELSHGRDEPHGVLRMSVPILFGQTMMGKLAAKFAMAYPDVELQVTLEDRPVDLVNEGYDLVIRVSPEPTTELVGRCFVREQVFAVSTPEFHQRFYRPKSGIVQPLPVVSRAKAPLNGTWKIINKEVNVISTKTVLRLPLLTMIRDAVLTSIGAARLPGSVVADDIAVGRLVSWGVASDQPAEIWVLQTSKRLSSSKIKAFLKVLEIEFQKAWL